MPKLYNLSNVNLSNDKIVILFNCDVLISCNFNNAAICMQIEFSWNFQLGKRVVLLIAD